MQICWVLHNYQKTKIFFPKSSDLMISWFLERSKPISANMTTEKCICISYLKNLRLVNLALFIYDISIYSATLSINNLNEHLLFERYDVTCWNTKKNEEMSFIASKKLIIYCRDSYFGREVTLRAIKRSEYCAKRTWKKWASF